MLQIFLVPWYYTEPGVHESVGDSEALEGLHPNEVPLLQPPQGHQSDPTVQQTKDVTTQLHHVNGSHTGVSGQMTPPCPPVT